MKRLMSVISGCLIYSIGISQALQITTDKTTSLVFPFSIRYVDRGSKDILVQPVAASDNILLIKAAIKEFAATNLSVVTSDGSMYSFPVYYAIEPIQWVYNIPEQQHTSIESYAINIADNPRTLRGIRNKSWDVVSRVIGIYIKGKTIYYQLRLDNRSPIDYDIDFMRFYIRDKRKGKRTAVQEIELMPIKVIGNTDLVPAHSLTTIVVALEKFTIPDAKYLAIEVHEKNGGRHLNMKVRNKHLMKSIGLPDLK